MPAAAATAIGTIVATKIGSNTSRHATDAQMSANQQAIDYQKQQDAEAKAARATHEAQSRAAYMQFLRVHYPEDFAAQSTINANGNPLTGNTDRGGLVAGGVHDVSAHGLGSPYRAMGTPGVPAAAPVTLGTLTGAPAGAAPMAPPVTPPGGTLGDLASGTDWTDWTRYGARQ